MKTLLHGFTNQHGLEMAAAVMCISTANMQANSRMNLSIDLNKKKVVDGNSVTNPNFGERTNNETQSANVRYSVAYWIDADKKAAGAMPQQFDRRITDTDVENDMRVLDPAMIDGGVEFNFTVDDVDSISTPEELEDACLAHLKTEILKLES